MLKAIYINSDMKLSTKIILVFFFTAIVLAEE